MKLHYAALRKDMFLYMDILYWTFLNKKDSLLSFFFLEGMGGMSSLPYGINGVSGIGVLYLWGSPILSKWSQQLR